MSVRVPTSKELAAAFVELADTLVADFDVTELLYTLTEHCVNLLGVDAAGLLVLDAVEYPHVEAATPSEAAQLQTVQLEAGKGPCLETLSTGMPIAVPDTALAAERWPEFSAAAATAGVVAAHAIPMRLRSSTIGSLSLYGTETEGFTDGAVVDTAQAFADVATIGMLQYRAIDAGLTTSRQLSKALDSRVVIEQAKGVIAERHRVGMDAAFAAIRGHARRHRIRLTEVAGEVVHGGLDFPEPLGRG